MGSKPFDFLDQRAAVDPAFRYETLGATGPARAALDQCWVIQAERCRTVVETVLPDAAIEIYFNLGPTGRHLVDGDQSSPPVPRAAWVIGPHARRLLVAKETRDCYIFGVRLRPGAGHRVLGVPVRELGDTLVDLAEFWGATAEELRERLAAASDPRVGLRILEDAVLRKWSADRDSADGQRLEALCAAVGDAPTASVGRAADAFGLTHRQVIALFDQHVGLKPKSYQRVRRARRVMKAGAAVHRPQWAQIAASSGYYDQAHMINDFRRLTGMTPRGYLARRSSVGHGFVPHQVVPDR